MLSATSERTVGVCGCVSVYCRGEIKNLFDPWVLHFGCRENVLFLNEELWRSKLYWPNSNIGPLAVPTIWSSLRFAFSPIYCSVVDYFECPHLRHVDLPPLPSVVLGRAWGSRRAPWWPETRSESTPDVKSAASRVRTHVTHDVTCVHNGVSRAWPQRSDSVLAAGPALPCKLAIKVCN